MREYLFILLGFFLAIPLMSHALSDSNIVSYWKLDEASGAQRNDSTSNAYHFTNNGTVTGVAGILNNGASGWSGTNFLSRADNDNFDLSGSWTVSFWIRSSAWTANAMGILDKYVSGTNGWILYLQGNGGAPVFYTNNGAGVMIATNALATNTWYHYCIYSDGSNITFRRNGAQDTAPQTFTAPAANTASMVVGKMQSQARPMNANAIIDELTIFTRSLGSTECDELYGSGTPPAYPFASGGSSPFDPGTWTFFE